MNVFNKYYGENGEMGMLLLRLAAQVSQLLPVSTSQLFFV